MTDDHRDGASEEIVTADPSGVPVEASAPAEAEAPGGGRKGRKATPKGKRGLRLPRRFKKAAPGSAAGIEPHELVPVPGKAVSVRITAIDYSPQHVQVEEVQDLPAFTARHRPEWSAVRWINVDGLGDLGVIRALAEKYRLHPLAVEDVLHIPQRPKVQAYEEDAGFQARLFIIVRELELREKQLHTEQVSI
ncbi:MAG TPA: magnesium and cobalt transport protein CorA, partial [Vicinamibacteria bacterium]|nr:magnesium and cobalt transport protein CorA [Vicinamibacteria bacterium]